MASLPLVPAAPAVRRAAAIAGAAALAAALLVLWLIRSPIVAAGFLGSGVVAGGAVAAWRLLAPVRPAAASAPDWGLARALAQGSDGAVAITDRAGRLVCCNDAYGALFGGYPTPPGLPLDAAAVAALGVAGRAAWRDGEGGASGLTGPSSSGRAIDLAIVRAGDESDMLVWRFAERNAAAGTDMAAALGGELGDRLGRAGVMAAVVDAAGHASAATQALARRAWGGGEVAPDTPSLGDLLVAGDDGELRFAREGTGAGALRLIPVPLDEPGEDGLPARTLLLLLDAERPIGSNGNAGAAHVHGLVAALPLGMALVGRDGRFVQINDAFRRAAAVDPAAAPVYPGDLVVREDKAALADAVRRFAGGVTAHTADLAIRLKDHPDEPVVLTIAGARGLGDAAVLLSLKDNTEEARLKRQVAQATKMQAVGQLAGGVAHDFNNILTAIIGHCDLMLMRHSPGDSDYDDIQQIRTNSNRAASLTRQLLAFSRQQTLRPQILQLPDVVSEVSSLLKRLLGETVKLVVVHGRDLGAVRADPGQLEQVVVNLAVNARDAMLGADTPGECTLTIQTRAVSAGEVKRMGSDILPAADYTALVVSDTGQGIPADILPKIFEPFFTTKEMGKGTGLGLSTVYGIVKQSGGWIFADSSPGKGSTFTIYLPVHASAGPAPLVPAPRPAALPANSWGTGTILLVEDEAMVRAVAERALARQGYTVLVAENGDAALELVDANGRPDLLVSDVVMPGMDGPTVARHIRERYPDLPILFMSGYAEEQLRRSIDLDLVAFLPKPFSVQQLAEAARDALAAREGGVDGSAPLRRRR